MMNRPSPIAGNARGFAEAALPVRRRMVLAGAVFAAALVGALAGVISTRGSL